MSPDGRTFKLSNRRLELLKALRREQGLASAREERIPRRPPAEAYPLSFSQQRLWLLDRLQPGSPAYNMPTALRLRGELDLLALERSLSALAARHGSLRTTFASSGEDDGEPLQRVSPPALKVLPRIDLDGLPEPRRETLALRLAAEEARRPFDLAEGPLARIILLRLGPADHVVIATLHHIITDGWSMEIFTRDLAALYSAAFDQKAPPALPELPIQYSDFACWQRDWAAGGGLDRQLDYWKKRLAGAPSRMDLPTDRPQLPVPSFRGGTVAVTLSREVSETLSDRGQDGGATPFMVLFALFATLLQAHTGQEDLLIGTPIAGRNRPELEGLIGFFANTLVLRADLRGDPPFRELLSRVRDTTLGAYAHQDLPFERLVEEMQPERSLGHTPLFEAMLVLQQAAAQGAVADLHGLSLATLPAATQVARLNLAVNAIQGERGIRLVAEYRADLFDAVTVRRLLARFASLAAAAAAGPERRLSELPVLTPSERHQVLAEWNDWNLGAAEPSPDPLLHSIFAARAALEPDRVALVCGAEQLSYGELDGQANRFASRLRVLGVGPEVTVGLAMQRSVELIMAILAVLKAGGAYLPLDPESPVERLAFVLEDAKVTLLLADEQASAVLAAAEGIGTRVLNLGAARETLALQGDRNPSGGAAPDDLAYVIYTSGSTGRPKGVMVSHRAVCGTLMWRLSCFSLTADDCILQNIAFTFDPSIWQIFGALLAGSRLVLVPPGGHQDFAGLVRAIAAEQVTITDLAPSMLAVFLEQEELASCQSLRLLFAGGEALSPDLAARFLASFPGATLQNIYGPTEAAIDAATWTCGPLAAGRTMPIGRPVASKRLLLLDSRLAPVPIGVPGELYIGGPDLARGYVGSPALTAERFLPAPWTDGDPGARLYRTGDLVRQLADGAIEFLGRVDRQVKVRGFRVELGEIEVVLAQHPGVRESVVVVHRDRSGEPMLAAYFAPAPVSAGEPPATAADLRAFLRGCLPAYMVPAVLVTLPALPRTAGGKVDPQALPAPTEEPEVRAEGSRVTPRTALENAIAGVWKEVLGVEEVGVDDNFFDLGGHSLLLVRVHSRLQKLLEREIPIVDLFHYSTVEALARHLGAEPSRPKAGPLRRPEEGALQGIAIVGMAGRFPGARDVEEFWRNLREGQEAIRFFSDDELLSAGVPAAALARPDYVKARGMLDGIDLFDARFFDFSPREAEIMDPQQRLFLECAWHALESAGYDPARFPGAIGVYAGVSANTYFLRNVLANPEVLEGAGANQAMLGGDKDFLATRVSYKLNLKGPSFTVQTACSTSLVAVHLACRALLGRECDMALAGGVSVAVPQIAGYQYREGGISSSDGHCRAFDARAQGTVSGSGLGVVVLKPLGDALAAGDHIHAVIRGSSINNDGSTKVGYTAPSVEGQAAVIAAAQERAGVEADDISYVEAHGTGTPLGDPIEIAALRQAFRASSGRRDPCALGSVKTNIGHLDAAAGVAGLIKTVLALEHEEIPPSLHFEQPNPQIDFAAGPFRVSTALTPWRRSGVPRRAGVSSFGIGGTNAHLVLEEAPRQPAAEPSRPLQLLVLSARSEAALEAVTDNLAGYLGDHPEADLADVAYTYQVGRRAMPYRRTLLARDTADAAAVLAGREPSRVLTLHQERGRRRPVAFLFPGQGAQHPGMGGELYRTEPTFRAAVDACSESLIRHLDGLDLRRALYPETAGEPTPSLEDTRLAQPALFTVEYALACLWREWGVEPEAMLGHSIGEYVAACLAGVFSLADALALVAARGRLMQALPRGAMLAVPLSEEEVLSLPGLANGRLSLAAVNAPSLSVVSGPEEEIEALRARLLEHGIEGRRLHTSHAFHSSAMEPALAPFREAVAAVRLEPPRIPFLSNLTGTWITAAEATDPDYWARHLRQPVRFAAGVSELLSDPDRVLLEVGPGRTLGTLARRQAERGRTVLESLPHPTDGGADGPFLLGSLGRLWLAGVEVDWAGFHAHARRRRLPLPVYPFERQRYWIESRPTAAGAPPRSRAHRREEVADWFSVPVWNESPLLASAPAGDGERRWLLFEDRCGLGAGLAAELSRQGETVIRVAAGEGFAKLPDGTYRVASGRRQDYSRLLAEIGATEPLPNRIVHLWGVTPEAGAEPLDVTLDECFSSLLYLAQTLAERRFPGPVELVAVANGLHDLTGEEILKPEKSVLLGPLRVIPQEYPGASCRSVDIVLPAESGRREDLVARLMTELTRGSRDPMETEIALRGRHRWVRGFEPVRLGRTSGLAAPATLSVVDIPATSKGGPIQLAEDGGAAERVAAAIRSIRTLGSALEARPLDLFVVVSSLAPVLGGVGQVEAGAVGAYLNGFAARLAARGSASVLSIDWEGGGLAEKLGEVVDRALASGLPRVVVSPSDLVERLAQASKGPSQEAAPVAPPVAPPSPGHSRPEVATPYVAPRNETERLLAGIWEEVLGIDRVGVHDDFSELGGHSLLAIQVLSRVRQAAATDLSLRSIFDAPTVAQLAVQILQRETASADGETLDQVLARLDQLSEEEAEALLAGEEMLIELEVGEGADE